MRILIAADGSTGDVHPMLLFAERAQALGHEVRVAAPCDFEEDAEKLSVPFTPVGGPVKPYLQRIANELHHGASGSFAKQIATPAKRWPSSIRRSPSLGRGAI